MQAVPSEDVMRELHYCSGEPGWQFSHGQVARAQAAALAQGWLECHAARPGFLSITAAGVRYLANQERPG